MEFSSVFMCCEQALALIGEADARGGQMSGYGTERRRGCSEPIMVGATESEQSTVHLVAAAAAAAAGHDGCVMTLPTDARDGRITIATNDMFDYL